MLAEIREMCDEGLIQLAEEIRVEQERRMSKKKEKLWNEVQEAIKNYTKEVGAIEIVDECEDSIIIGYFDNLSTPGKMEVNYD